MTTTLTNPSTRLNGIDVGALRDTIDATKLDAAAAQTTWAVHSRWMGDTRSDHAIERCRIGGKELTRGFTIRIDEPLELCGTNQFANPQEHLLSAMNACMMVGYSAVAALMGIRLTKLEVRTWGDIDLRGFLGVDPTVTPGYERLEQEVTIAGDGTPEQFREIHDIVRKTSPNYFNITSAVATNSRLVVR